MAGRAIVCGGSIGGLFSAAALLRAGWQVDVYERSGVELAGRGAGIVTHAELVEALQAVGAGTDDLGVEVTERVAFDLAGARVRSVPHRQVVTSWDRIHQLLRALIPETHHHLGRTACGYRQDRDCATLLFDDGSEAEADVVIGADGFRSALRGQMLPDVQPEYSGYVVWRTLANEQDLSPALHAQVFAAFGLFLPTGTQIIGYPIAGQGNDLRPGYRRYNFVWYRPVPRAELDDILTDAGGVRHALSIPPPLVRAGVLARMEADAARQLPQPFIEMLARSERPFFTPIYDHLSPVFADGRVALAGDAACVARPHVGMGVTKAALDALSLARNLSAKPIADALAAYSAERQPAARAAFERSRRLGSYIFQVPDTGTNHDGRSNPNLETILRDTAVVV